MSLGQAAPDLALIAQSAMLQLEAALVLDDPAAIAQACVDGTVQLYLIVGPLQMAALDLELAAALAKS